MKPKWLADKENGDGTGRTFYACLINDTTLCYHPSLKRLWHYSNAQSGAAASYEGATWQDANRLKVLLQNPRAPG